MEAWRNELYHHGILGQKWGQRRFQNKDGSLTPEGRERYGVGEENNQSEPDPYSKLRPNDSYNQELDRVNMDYEYEAMMREEAEIEASKAKTRKILTTVGVGLAIAGGIIIAKKVKAKKSAAAEAVKEAAKEAAKTSKEDSIDIKAEKLLEKRRKQLLRDMTAKYTNNEDRDKVVERSQKLVKEVEDFLKSRQK